MIGILVIVHIVVAVLLILIVLMQGSKSEGLSGLFGGGGSTTLFGTGAPTFLAKVTTVLGIIFMLSSITLSVFLSRSSKSVMGKSVIEEQETVPEESEGEKEGIPGEDTVEEESAEERVPPDEVSPGVEKEDVPSEEGETGQSPE